jgi:hypothetical protein
LGKGSSGRSSDIEDAFLCLDFEGDFYLGELLYMIASSSDMSSSESLSVYFM